MTNEVIRSFIAFDISNPHVLKKIADVQRALIATGADLKTVEPQNIHITLKFLGDVQSYQVDDIYKVMKNISMKAFNIELQGLGVFPNLSRIKVIWVGITRGYEELSRIAEELNASLKVLGFPPENRKFSVHLTIARVKSGKNKEVLASEVGKYSNQEFGIVTASSLKLKKSILTPQGPIYSILREVAI